MFWPFFYLENPVDGLLVEDIATDSVHGIGGVADDAPMPEYGNGLVNQALLGVIRVDGQNGHGNRSRDHDENGNITGTTL